MNKSIAFARLAPVFISAVAMFVAPVASAAESAPVPATGYFVDCSLASNGDGTLAGPWNNLDSVNKHSFPSGADVWIKGGTVCQNQVLTHDWNGISEANPAIIGGYYVSGGVAYQNTPTNWAPWRRPRDYTYTVPRPIIQGTYRASCRKSLFAGNAGTAAGPGDPNKCVWYYNDTYKNLPASLGPPVPSQQDAGLVFVRHMPNYHDQIVQDLEVKDSAGKGITVGSDSPWCRGTTGWSGDAGCVTSRITVQRNHVHHCAGGACISVDGGTMQVAVMFNQASHDNLSTTIDNQYGGYGSGGPLGFGATINVSPYCNPCQVLVEGNDIHDGWGESVGTYGPTYVLMRGNEIGNHGRAGYNGGSGAHMVWEQNLIAGGTIRDDDVSDLPNYPHGLSVRIFWAMSAEHNAHSGPGGGYYRQGMSIGEYHLRRNNLQGSLGVPCVQAYSLPDVGSEGPGGAANPDPAFVDNTDVGNTCMVGPTAGAASYEMTAPSSKLNFIHNKNNLYVMSASSSNCAYSGQQMHGKGVFSHNQWTRTPADISRCGGSPGISNVFNSNSGLPGTWDFADDVHVWPDLPTVAEFTPALTGAGAAAGTALTGVVTSNQNNWWDWILSKRTWLPECNTTGDQVPDADWHKALTTDYCGNPRNATTTIGAVNASEGRGFNLTVD